MNQKQISSKLRSILNREDIDTDGLLSRKKSCEHESEIEVLLEHVSLLVSDLRFNLTATRRELFDARCLLEE